MPLIENSNPIAGGLGPIAGAGAPGAGTDEVQTITFGGTPTGGTFTIAFDGRTTAPITWSAVNATLQGNMDTALEALLNIGTGGVAVTVGTAVAGIGTFIITFSGANLAKRAQPLAVAGNNLMTGTSPTAVIAETTPGVTATAIGLTPGGIYVDRTNATVSRNSGTAAAPAWTAL